MSKSKICDHPDRKKIEAAIRSDDFSLQDIADRFGLSKASVHRHKNNMAPVTEAIVEQDIEIKNCIGDSSTVIAVANDNQKENCGICKYWQRGFNDYGECHRFPPQCTNNNGSRFPAVTSNNHCGEWQLNPLFQ